MCELDYKESWVQKNWCFWIVVLKKTAESPLDCQEIQPVHPKGDQSLCVYWMDLYWSWNCNTLGTWCEDLTHLKRPCCWERLKGGGKWDNRGWDSQMASPTQWTWVWVNSGSWWRTGRPGVLWFMGLQRVGHDWVTELNFENSSYSLHCIPFFDVWLADIFSYSVACLFSFTEFSKEQSFLILMKSNFSNFLFCVSCFWCQISEHFAKIWNQGYFFWVCMFL